MMRALRTRPEHAIVAALAAGVALAMIADAANQTGGTARLNDFYREAAPSYLALTHGHLLAFAQLTPAYGGSLVLRAPFALVPALWGGSLRAIYFASALPCMLAAVAFCVWVAGRPRRNGASWRARIVAVVCCVGSPIVLIVLQARHPEEVLGDVLCVAAVVLAANGRAEWAGLLVGVAVANKAWALVAVPVVIAALPARRWRTLIIAGGCAAVVLVPLAAAREHGLTAAANGASVGSIFNPPQLLWWAGRRSWIAREARPAIILASLLLTLLWCGLRRRPGWPTRSGATDALLLLSLVLLLRAALDPWNNVWYHLPFLFALLALETRSGRAPLAMVGCMMALLVVVPLGGVPMSTNLRAVAYAAIVLPMIAGIAIKLYLPSGRLRGEDVRKGRVSLRLSTDQASLP